MNGLTRFFLILLRLAIGWHFLFEGLDKLRSVELGPSETNRPWTSKPYLKEATGPLAGFFRKQAGETDEDTLALLQLKPIPSGKDPAAVAPRERVSPALDQQWNDYLERFAGHYQLSDEQRRLAQAKVEQAKDQAGRWLMGETEPREVEKSAFGATVKVKETGADRVKAYRKNLELWAEIEGQKLPAFNSDVEKAKLKSLKAEIAKQRAEIVADLQKPLVDALSTIITEEQKKKETLPEQPAPTGYIWNWNGLAQVDFVTRYGLTAVGACLLLGLFTRTACIAGAGFLLMFYLSMPPFPWLPDNPKAEGHYLFINKNLIEMLALLVLSTTQSGRWVGLDGFLHAICPWKRRSQGADAKLVKTTRGPRAPSYT